MIEGIDVSSYQSETFSTQNRDFCFVKATEGTSYVNPKQWAQADHARSAGLVVGFYHYLRPGDIAAQARYFVEKCASRPGDPLWADWEESGVSCRDKDAFLREVLRLRGDSHRVGLYCSQDFWLHHDTTSYCAEALWIANYNGRPGSPGVQHPWKFHQYASKPIDTSVGAFTSRAALKAWATKKPAAPAPKEESMSFDLDTNLPVGDWIKKRWPEDKSLQNGIWVQTALSSGYGHARRAGDASEEGLAELKALRAEVAELKKTFAVLDPAKIAADLEKVIESAKLRFEIPDA